MNFLKYSTPEELKKETGFTVKEALKIIDSELEKIRREKQFLGDIMIDRPTDDEFFSNIFRYAIIIKADISTINELKRFIADKNIQVIFQKISTTPLWIKEGNNEY